MCALPNTHYVRSTYTSHPSYVPLSGGPVDARALAADRGGGREAGAYLGIPDGRRPRLPHQVQGRHGSQEGQGEETTAEFCFVPLGLIYIEISQSLKGLKSIFPNLRP